MIEFAVLGTVHTLIFLFRIAVLVCIGIPYYVFTRTALGVMLWTLACGIVFVLALAKFEWLWAIGALLTYHLFWMLFEKLLAWCWFGDVFVASSGKVYTRYYDDAA